MELCFKLATGLLLLFQAFHPTLLQDTTDSPGRTIDVSWYRVPANNALVSQMQSVEEPIVGDQELHSGSMASTVDDTNGSTFGSYAISSGENEENQEHNINGIHDGMTVITTPMLPTFPIKTDTESNVSSTPAAPKTEPTTHSNPDTTMNNGSNSEGKSQNYTKVASNYTDQMTPNVSTSPTFSDATEFKGTTLAPEAHVTNESRGGTDPENWLNTIKTEETTSSEPNISNTTAPEEGAAPSLPLPTNTITTESPPPETTVNETVPVTMTTVVPGTTEKSNATDREAASGESNTDRGLVSSSDRNKQNEAWAAILGTAVAVCVLALVIFVILKKKNQKAFSHRKLVEFSPDPVLTLDNNESLDSNYGRGAYHNPALQMTTIPSRYNGPNQDSFLD